MTNAMTHLELIRPWQGFDIRYALFDFDGTISLIRQGWQDIMIPYFTEVLREAAPGRRGAAARACATLWIR